LAFALSFALAHCGADPDKPATSPPGMSTPPIEGGADGATSRGDAGDAGNDAALACAPDASTVCARDAKWGAAVALSVSSAADEQLGAVSPDERHIAWAVPLGAGAGAEIHYADRALASDAFGAGATLAPADYAANERVALSADGLRLVVVRADRRALGVFTRATLADTFAGPDEDALHSVNRHGEGDVALGDPLLSADGTTLYFYLDDGHGSRSFHQMRRPFDLTAVDFIDEALDAPELQSTATSRLRLTGIASDDRTLFYYDASAGILRAAYRSGLGCAFTAFVAVGPYALGTPNAACDRLYHGASGTAPADLLVSAKK
jgi:hypothetical protein